MRQRHDRINDHFGPWHDTTAILNGPVGTIPDGVTVHDALKMIESGGADTGDLGPINWADPDLGTTTYYPSFTTPEWLTGQTVFVGNSGGSGLLNPQYANDRGGGGSTHMNETVSERPSFAGSGTITYWWGVDLGVARAVTGFRIWPPPGLPRIWEGPGSQFTNLVEWSDNGTSWFSTPYTYSTAVVSTGNSSPYGTQTTEHRYVLNSVSEHRYWRIRKTGSFGLQFFSGDGMSNWYIDGVSEPTWVPGPLINDDNPATYNEASYGTACLRVAMDQPRLVYDATVRMAFSSTAARTYSMYGTNQSDYSGLVLLDNTTFTPTGGNTPDDVFFDWAILASYQYLVLVGPYEGRRLHEVTIHALIASTVYHPLTTERNEPGQHPADGMTLDAVVGLSSSDVQDALERLVQRTAGVEVVLFAVTTGHKVDLELPFAGLIREVRLLADATVNVVLDLWKSSYASFPPTVADSICGGSKPTLAAAVKYQNTTLSGWTTAFNEGDIIRVNVDSASVATRLLLGLRLERAL